MQWLSENWLLVVLFGGMGAMHLFGHGKGGHGKGGHGCCAPAKKQPQAEDMAEATDTAGPGRTEG